LSRRSRESCATHPGATTGVTLAHDVGCARVAPNTSDTPRYPPRGAQHVPARPRQACLSHSAWQHRSYPQYFERVPHRPERRPSTHSRHDRRDSCTLRGASEVASRGPNLRRTSPRESPTRIGTTTGAVPGSCGCFGVTSEAQDPHVASRRRLVSNPTTMGGTSSGRRCCFPGVTPRAVSLCRSPRRACGSVHTPARPVVFTDRRPAASW